MQYGGVGDMIPPRHAKNVAKASEMKCIEPVFLAAVCAPRLAHRIEDCRLPKDILYSEFYNAPRRTGRTKLRYKDVIKRNMADFHISPQSWEALAADRYRWRASLSFGYSLSATSYAEKMEKRWAHHRQWRDGPWWKSRKNFLKTLDKKKSSQLCTTVKLRQMLKLICHHRTHLDIFQSTAVFMFHKISTQHAITLLWVTVQQVMPNFVKNIPVLFLLL